MIELAMLLMLSGALMMFSPLIDHLPAIGDVATGVGRSLRRAYPVTRNDGLFENEIEQLGEEL